MSCFGALVSLRRTIERKSFKFSFPHPSREIIKSALNDVISIKAFLWDNEKIINANSSNERVNSLNRQITEAAYKLEDALESHVSYYQSRSLADEGFLQEHFLDLEEVKEEINSFSETVENIKKTMMEELSKPMHEEDDVCTVPSGVDFGGKDSKMVGLSEEFSKLKHSLTKGYVPHNFIAITGMAGIGKTALAMKIFEDPSISSHFDSRVFVTLGPKRGFKEVKLSILAQMNHNIDEMRTAKPDSHHLDEHVRRSLQGRRCLIVLDDVWSSDVKNLLFLFPYKDDRSRIVLTTRLQRLAFGIVDKHFIYFMPFLNTEESWDLLREKVFGEGYSCPFQLEKLGIKIAENCDGLPLTIVTVANILSKEDKTLEYWKKVAEKENSVFTDAYDQMYEVLISSYHYLPQYLKPCFLYMGVFPLSCKIPVSKLVKLWRVEQFLSSYSLKRLLRPDTSESFENHAKTCLKYLVSSSIIVVDQWGSKRRFGHGDYVKTCRLHSVYWHLCVKEADKEKFFHFINQYVNSFTEGIQNQRRLCIHNNILFGIKEVRNSMESISMVYSLLCTGPYHQYPVPICSGLRSLRVLDALTIRFYKFPIEVLKLVRLKHLALTYSGKIPGSISKLWNLEHLIVHRHLSINNSSGDSSYLPMEIWNMKELKHVQVTGSNLPDPCGAFLPNLLTLSDMSVNSCSREILERTPNLNKLGIQIELSPNVVEPLCCFDHLSHLRCLESLKCVVVNPKPESWVVAPITTFPSHLEKLSLSGLGYPWECMRMIGKLPYLRVLKLRCYAFQGPVWETYDGEFSQLEYLLLEDTDLVHWRVDSIYCFPSLRRLIIKHCYRLKEIPSSFRGRRKLALMELVDCPSFKVSLEQLQEEYQFSNIYVHSSLDDEKQESSQVPLSVLHSCESY